MIEMEKRHLDSTDCNTSKVAVCKHHSRSNYCCVLQVIQRCFYQKGTWEIPLLHMWAIIFSDKRHTVATCGCVVTAQWFEGNDSSQIQGIYSSFQSSGSVKLEKQHFQLSKRCIETDTDSTEHGFITTLPYILLWPLWLMCLLTVAMTNVNSLKHFELLLVSRSPLDKCLTFAH